MVIYIKKSLITKSMEQLWMKVLFGQF